MRRFGTGAQAWPLNTGSNNNPDLVQGETTSFFCNTVPDRATTGPLANVLPYVLLTIYGTITQPASNSVPIYQDVLTACLIQSINWINAWHGTPVSSNHVLGSNLPVVEFLAGGYRYAMRRRPAIAAAAGDYKFSLTVAIPASAVRFGDLMASTSQLALLYQESQIQVNVAPASVLDSISPGAVFKSGTLNARCSAVVYPSSELVLGTPVETILHQTVAGSNSNEVQIRGFGTSTLMNGVKKKGGVLFLGELTDQNLQGGVFIAGDALQLQFPWRGQNQTQHMESLVSPMIQCQGTSRPQTQPTIIVGGDSEFAGYPYPMSNSDQTTVGGEGTSMDIDDLLFFPLVYPDVDVQLADLQTADHDESYFLTVDGGFDSGTHQILAMYARQFEQGMLDDWQRRITNDGKGGLAQYVLGGQGLDWRAAKLAQRLPASRYVVTDDQRTYLPYQFA